MVLVFDMDGVLVDTEEATRRAYEAAGLVMPRAAWGLTWLEWGPRAVEEQYGENLPLHPNRFHEMKKKLYPFYFEDNVKDLPLLSLLRDHAPESWILTGASVDTCDLVQKRFRVPETVAWVRKANLDVRVEVLNRLSADHPDRSKVYFDDRRGNVMHVRQHCPGWQVTHVQRGATE